MIREIEGSVRKNPVIENSVLNPCHYRITPYRIVSMFTFVEESLLISFSVRFDLSSFYSRFTSKQCNVCLYFQLTMHIHL